MSSKIIDNLVSSAKNGSAEAFGELYEMYSKDMFRFAYYYLGSYAMAEDCVSECVCLAFQKIGSLRKSSSFKSWLFKILSNKCKTLLMKKNAQQISTLISLSKMKMMMDTRDTAKAFANIHIPLKILLAL